MPSGNLIVVHFGVLTQNIEGLLPQASAVTLQATTAWHLRPGALDMILRLRGLPVALISPLSAVETVNILGKIGVAKDYFIAMKTTEPVANPALQLDEETHGANQILEILAEGDAGPLSKLFVIGNQTTHMQSARRVQRVLTQKGSNCPVLAIAPRGDGSMTAPLEDAGAWCVTADLKEAAELLVAASRHDFSDKKTNISFVLMALNESVTIGRCIDDVRQFAELYCNSHEIIVVDDGSSDDTSERAKAANPNVRVIRHPVNMGMGATMRDGYHQARLDYIVALPADRQVRAHSLIHFLPHLAPGRVVTSQYYQPHSGWMRKWVSLAFRFCVRWVGGLAIDFAGAYVFPRAVYAKLPLERAASNTFVFSFELLQLFQQAKCEFKQVMIHPFLREVGSSRELRPGRMLKVLRELFLSRLRRIVSRPKAVPQQH